MSRVLVCVTPYVPYAGIDHAGGEYLRRYLDRAEVLGWDVRIIAPDSAANRAARSARDVVLHPHPGLLRRGANLLRSGVPATSGPAWLAGIGPRARAWLADADVVDLQWADSIWNAPAIRVARPDAHIVAMAHDLRTQSVRRACGLARGRARFEALLATPRVTTCERRALLACDRVLVFKPGDRDSLARYGIAHTGLAPVPVAGQEQMPRPDLSARRVVFVAAMHRPENVEAAMWLLDEVLPIVRRQVPELRVRLAGSRPPPALARRANADVEVTGYLDDLVEAYRDVACVAVPLRRGAGVKFKTVDAVAAGFPVVSTTTGAEGVEEVLGRGPQCVTDAATSFADGLVRALSGGVPGRPPMSVRSFEEQVDAVLDGLGRPR